MLGHRILLAAIDRPLADAHVGNRHRQQDQVGEHDHCHTNGSADGQLADHPDVDNQQRDKADRIGQNRDHAGQKQLTKRPPCSGQGVVGLAGLQGNTVDLLYTVRDADGEDQKRHQHRIRVNSEPYNVHQPQLPDHRNQRGDQHGDGAAKTAGEPDQQHQCDQKGDAEEHHHHEQTVDQITDLLGETDDMNLDVGVLCFVLVADLLFKLVRELLIVQRQQLALICRVRVGLLQRHINDAGFEIVGDQPPDLSGLEHVVAQQIQTLLRTVVTLRNHFASGKALLRHFGPAYARAPQRLQARPVDAGNIEHLVADLTQRLHVLFGEDVAVLGLHRDTNGVTQIRQIVAVFHHVLNERMRQRDHLLETGGRPHLRGLPEQKEAGQQAEDDDCRAMVENQAFKEGCLFIRILRVLVRAHA